MSYKRGDLRMTVEKCGHEECDGDDYCGRGDFDVKFWVVDSRDDDSGWSDTESSKRYGAYLPHSCDEWYIGGEDEIVAMIEDLRYALRRLRGDR